MKKTLIQLESKQVSLLLIYTMLVCIFILYIIFFNSYRAELLDNAWMMYFIYWSDSGDALNVPFGYPDGLSMFAEVFEGIYFYWFNLLGWYRDNGFILSILFSLSSMIFFYHSIVSLGYEKIVAILFVLLLAVFDPYVGMAHKLRWEAFTLFIISVSFLLLIKKQHVLSGLFAVMAIETHPAGAFVFVYSGAVFLYWFLNNKNITKSFIFYILGLILGIGFYVIIHYDDIINLSNIVELVSKNYLYKIGHFWVLYFWAPGRQYYYRHIPEIIAIFMAVFIYFRYENWKLNRNFELYWFLLAVLVGTFAPKFNYQYIVYAYVPIMFFMVIAFYRAKILNLFVILFLMIQIPQYVFLQYLNYGYDHKIKIKEYQVSVPINKTIIGPETAWYAFKDKNFKTYEYYFRWTRAEKYFGNFPDEFTLIVDPFFRKRLLSKFNQANKDKYKKKKIKEFREHYKKRLIEIYSYSKISPSKRK